MRQKVECPDNDAVQALVEGRVGEQARDEVLQHVETCSQCRRAVVELIRRARAAVDATEPAGQADDALAAGVMVGRYRIERLLGAGAMGRVYAAHDPQLDRRVALKLLHSRAAAAVAATTSRDGPEGGPGAQDRLLAEARAVAQVRHPNVVTVHDVGTFGGRVFVAMELVDGGTLRHWLRDGKPGWREIVERFVAAGRGLAAAHAAGVVHRDFKPDNVLVGKDGWVRVADFGTAVLGTPAYMAPEQHADGTATTASDQFCFCVALHEALHGARPFAGRDEAELLAAKTRGVAPPANGAHVPAWLDGVLARGLRPAPADRHPSMDSLLQALERGPATLVHDAPYPGLLPFEIDQAPLFFGRRAATTSLVERLRRAPFVLVTGDSGVGKSSLCRAGLLAAVVRGEMQDGLRWSILTMTPGRRPLAALAACLSPWLDVPEADLLTRLREDPTFAAAQGRRLGEEIVLFVDQLEEIVTLADPAEAALAAAVLAGFCLPAPNMRLVASARSDFLTRLASLPALGAEIERAIFLLRAMSSEEIGEAITGPARLFGARFERDEMVGELIASALAAPGGLPLLQFALRELWAARDRDRDVLSGRAFAAIGGVGGALARYADGVVDGLLPEQRTAARRLLVRLITEEGTRARRSRDEIVEGPAAAAALEALVAARLLVAREGEGAPSYEISHEALVTGWTTLRGWLGHDAEALAAHQRLGRAAADWNRLGKQRARLWRREQIAELARVAPELARAAPDGLAPLEREFLQASRRGARRRRALVAAVIFALPVALLAVYLATRAGERRELRRMVAAHLAQAEAARALGDGAEKESIQRRDAAWTALRAGRMREGEEGWTQSRARARDAEREWSRASRSLEAALALDRRSTVRRALAELTWIRLLAAERNGRHEFRDELQARLLEMDPDGAYARRLAASARLRVSTTPPGARLTLERYEPQGDRLILGPGQDLGTSPLTDVPVPAGSYRLTLVAPGRPPVFRPFVVERGAPLSIDVTIPAAEEIPAGFIYIPGGRFLYGSTEETDYRTSFLYAMTLHPVDIGPFMIARYETTFADWIEFLEALPPAERQARLPHATATTRTELCELRPEGDDWRFTFSFYNVNFSGLRNDRVRYAARTQRIEQDWLRMPVIGVSIEDAQDYAAWLDRTGRVPRARLCDEHEWEYASRGADGRVYTTGPMIGPDDLNMDVTYGRIPGAFGSDEVGSHPGGRSPFGVDDTSGNVWEHVTSVQDDMKFVMRGGSYYQSHSTVRLDNREATEPTHRHPNVGLRMCADVAAVTKE